MPYDNFSLGKDVVFDVTTFAGQLQLPVTTTSFQMKPEYTRVKSTAMDAVNREAALPSGHRGTITLDRRDNAIDAFFAGLEAAFYAGRNIQSATITETIAEADGTFSKYLYTGVSLTLDDSGKKTGDAKIDETIGIFASKKKQIT